VDEQEIGVSLKPEATKLEELRGKLYSKAKTEPTFRFYALYDKVYRRDVLTEALRISKEKKGAPGVDGQTFDQIKEYGEERWLQELQQQLQEKTYRPQPVRRVLIPKPGGGERPLGIPTIKDRVAQTAAKLILDPIFGIRSTSTVRRAGRRRDSRRQPTVGDCAGEQNGGGEVPPPKVLYFSVAGFSCPSAT
jgi:RNA-directed DNA polymerase